MPVASTTTACPRAGPGAPAVYRPRRPAATVLHRTVREHLETFLVRARSSDPDLRPIRPAAERALRDYLRCGIPAHGFARVYCHSCRHDYLVPFSCKVRDLCPSCGARRMVETAAHLVDTVLPRVPYRQWVVSVPKRVRWFLKHRARGARRPGAGVPAGGRDGDSPGQPGRAPRRPLRRRALRAPLRRLAQQSRALPRHRDRRGLQRRS